MKASETTLRNLLEGTRQFQIPLFQRPYSWTENNWQTLWEDLKRLYNNEVDGSYFIGAIVTQCNGGTAEGISPFLVIDGQQRLITLTILLAVMRSRLLEEKNPELKDKNQKLAGELYDTILTNKYKDGEDFYKVLPTQEDREIYQTLINAGGPSAEQKKCQIYQCHKFFQDKLKSLKVDLAKIKAVILERLILVNITSDDKENAFLIFESLNSKGQALTQADLVRNYIFMQLPVAQREHIYTCEWLPLQHKFKTETEEYAGELTTAFWFYLRKDGESISEKEVYQTLKKRFNGSDSNEIESKLKELVKFANYYKRLKFYNNEEEKKLRRWFKRLDRLDFTTCHIFLLNVYDEYQQGKISLEKFEKILSCLESYFVRRWFAKVPTHSLGNLFTNLYAEVKKTNPNDLVKGLQTVLSGYDLQKRWPSDEEFRQGIVNTPIYRPAGDNDRVKLILEILADYRSKEILEKDQLTIEHIMPQTLDDDWKSLLGDNWSGVHKKYLHTLGNLTLTGYNSELGNKPFVDKKMYLNYSSVSLNKYFHNIHTWNADEIEKRANHLAYIAIQIWPRP